MEFLKRLWDWLCRNWARRCIIEYRRYHPHAFSNLEMLRMLDDLEAEK